MRYAFAALAPLGCILLLPAEVLAQEHRDAGVGFFLQEFVRVRKCDQITLIDCEDPEAQVAGELFKPYYAYLCVFNGNAESGIAGVQLNLDYDGPAGVGVDISSWTSCSDLQFTARSWPASGSGNRITWSRSSNCQQEEPGGPGQGVSVLAGIFYVIAYSDDVLAVKPWVGVGETALKVANCESSETELLPEQGGFVAFSEDGSTPGKMPCYTRQYIEETFGGVKRSQSTGRR